MQTVSIIRIPNSRQIIAAGTRPATGDCHHGAPFALHACDTPGKGAGIPMKLIPRDWKSFVGKGHGAHSIK